jgi:predicted RNA-binding Zn-ribbon protein involved in translation (DUF1610 family)
MNHDHSHVDGNAIIGALWLALGTDADHHLSVVCAACGDQHHIARTRVYLRCPGTVIRCPNCGGVEIVLVEIHHHLHLTLAGAARLDLTAARP